MFTEPAATGDTECSESKGAAGTGSITINYKVVHASLSPLAERCCAGAPRRKMACRHRFSARSSRSEPPEVTTKSTSPVSTSGLAMARPVTVRGIGHMDSEGGDGGGGEEPG